MGYTEALSDGKLDGTPETLAILHDEAQHLSRLVEDLRTLSLADAGELSLTRRPIAPLALLERAASVHTGPARQKQVTLKVAASQALPQVEVDPDRIAQVLGNLISNALRYTPPGGKILLSAKASSSDHADHITGVYLQVQDTGSGIAVNHLPHIFDRFYRADKSRHQEEGESGLGLAIAKSLVEAHAGSIAVDSTPGIGTTFTILLPVQNHPTKS
jgi:signal transduction histidine kinase